MNLTHLNLSTSLFSGRIPSEISHLSKLISLDFSDIHEGRLEQHTFNMLLQNLIQLRELHLDALDISSPLPLALLNQFSLTSLSTSFVNGVGNSQKTFSTSQTYEKLEAELLSLELSNNKIGEKLPWQTLQFIDLHSNLLHGPFPIPPITTIAFSISNSKLTGEILPLICSLNSLKVLDLSNNNFNRIIPHCLGNFNNSLSVLNSFHGTFTAAFTKGNMLRNLNLNFNRIEGQVPRSLLNCEHLEVLDLGINKINDTFPHWLGTLLELRVWS
ncbi:hypothetical protein ACSBR1_029532 [Camellia fascicularis]